MGYDLKKNNTHITRVSYINFHQNLSKSTKIHAKTLYLETWSKSPLKRIMRSSESLKGVQSYMQRNII